MEGTTSMTHTSPSGYSMSGGETIYVSVALRFNLPIQPGQTSNVAVTNPHTGGTGPTTVFQYDRDVTWVANTVDPPSGYRVGYWFTGTVTTGLFGPALANGAAAVEGSGGYNSYALLYTD